MFIFGVPRVEGSQHMTRRALKSRGYRGEWQRCVWCLDRPEVRISLRCAIVSRQRIRTSRNDCGRHWNRASLGSQAIPPTF
jgi:hypothetical protein